MQNFSLMFSVLLTILTTGKVTKRYLAEKYEVSERTIMRYVEAIIASGVPIYSLRGRDGGYAISDDYQFDKSFFTENEIGRIVTCLKAIDRYDDKLNDSIIEKLRYMGQRKKKEKYLLETDGLIIDAGPWSNPTLYRSKMETLQKAIDERRTLNLMYVDKYDEKTHRLFDPYYRVLKEGVWYAYGWCHYRKDFRLFKLARIRSLIDTDKFFERRECDVYAKLDGSFPETEDVDLEIEFSSIILGDIEEWLGFDAVMERGYKYVAKARLSGGSALINKLLSFGSGIRVLAPAEVREELLVECKRILRNAGIE